MLGPIPYTPKQETIKQVCSTERAWIELLPQMGNDSPLNDLTAVSWYTWKTRYFSEILRCTVSLRLNRKGIIKAISVASWVQHVCHKMEFVEWQTKNFYQYSSVSPIV